MSELASLIAQLSGSSTQSADPLVAALKLARASIDTLALRPGQSIDAKVAGQLAAGLTLLTAANESFVLKLAAPLPADTPVTIRVTLTPQGPPAITVSAPNAQPQVAQPMQVPPPSSSLLDAQGVQQAPRSAAAAVPAAPASPAASGAPAAAVAAATIVAAPAAPAAPRVTATVSPAAGAAAVPPPQGEHPVRVLAPVLPQPATSANPVVPAPVAAVTTAVPAAIPSPPVLASVPQPQPASAVPYPVHVLPGGVLVEPRPRPLAPAPSPATAARLSAPPLNLADLAQAAARQDSAAPLLGRLATIIAAAAPVLPRPLLVLAQKVLANRIDLGRTTLDGKALETALLGAGVLSTARHAPDSRVALLALRAGLVALTGGEAVAPVAAPERPPPPVKGEPPRAPMPQPAVSEAPTTAEDTGRALLGQTDAALSRLKLLQAASQPPADLRPEAPLPRGELRVEIPVLFGAETGILQLLVDRDGKSKRVQRERGWRMRFAMNFTETGEVGADIAMLGRSASVAIWAAEAEIADALEALLPELGPAIQRHGIELTSLRIRRGAPRPAAAAPGQLLDSAR